MADQSQGSGRPWTWTPPPFMNRVMSTILQTPLLHRLISGGILLITFTGHKSGKEYTTPVGYLRDGSTFTILTKRFRKWWHNFEDPARVQLLVKGETLAGTAQAITEPEKVVEALRRVIAERPREAEIYEVEMNGNTPDPASLQRAAERVTVIRVEV